MSAASILRSRLLPGIATALTVALFVHLGNWQADKGQRLEAELAQRAARSHQAAVQLGDALADPAAMQDLPLLVHGHYLAQEQVFIDNQMLNGQPGLDVVVPLQIAGTHKVIVVNRGWLPWPDRQGPLPKVSVPADEVTVTGVGSVPSAKGFFLMPDHGDERPGLWSRLDLQRFSRSHPGTLQGFVVLQNAADAQDGLQRQWQPPENKVGMHRSYSLQWYGMACALVVFFLYSSWRRRGVA